MRLSKVLGLAGVAGVATAAGVVLVRRRRNWSEPDPSELRARLHERLRSSAEPRPGTDVYPSR